MTSERLAGWWAVVRHRQLSAAGYRRITLISLVVMILIIVSGAAVRLTGSGLGCPDWPSCTRTTVFAPMAIQPWIEQANRFINAAICIIAAVAVIGALVRVRRRPDLTWLAAGLVAGVVAEAVLGGILVLEKLPPQLVSAHFVLGMVVMVDAILLHHRAGLPDEGWATAPTVSRPQLWLSRLLLVGVTVIVVLGTVVTSTGPHGGDPTARRFHLSLHSVAQIHGTSVEAVVGLVVILCWWLARTSVPRAVLVRAEILLAVIVAQGIIGYVQYATKLPAGLVEVHVIGSVAVVLAAVHLHLSLVSRVASPDVPVPEPGSAPAAIVGS